MNYMGPMENNLEIGDLSKITTYQAGALQAAANRMLRLHCDSILSAYGINKNQWMVIGLALETGKDGILLSEISRRLDINAKNVAGIVSALERQDRLVRVNKGRQVAIAIHPIFARDCPEIERMLRRALRKSIYSAVTPLEFRMYLKVLYQLSRLRPDWPDES